MASLLESFAKHENDLWKQLSEKLGGKLTDEAGTRHDKLVAKVGPWAVTLDIHSEPGYRSELLYTRLRGPFVNPDGFRFAISHQTVFANIAALMGMQDIKVDHDPFDKMYRVQGNDPDKLKQLFDDGYLREMVKKEPDIHVQVRDAGNYFEDYYPDEVDELVVEVAGEVKDLERLERLYSIFARMMNDLCRLGSAYET